MNFKDYFIKSFFSLLCFLLSSFCSFVLSGIIIFFNKEKLLQNLEAIIISILSSFVFMNEIFFSVPIFVAKGLQRGINLEYLMPAFLCFLLLISAVWGLRRYFNSSAPIMNVQKLWPFFIAIFLWNIWGAFLSWY